MKKLICFIFGHQYRLLRKITDATREVKCKRCKVEFGMNDTTQSIFEMDEDLRIAHSWLK
jgi:Prophage protein (DUF1660)